MRGGDGSERRGDSLAAGFRSVRSRIRRAAIRRIQDQGRAHESRIFSTRDCSTTEPSSLRLAGFYADRLIESGPQFDMVFGPAYKGIPLAPRSRPNSRGAGATSVRLQPQGSQGPRRRRHAGRRAPRGRVLIVDDVMSAGTAVRESIAAIPAPAPRRMPSPSRSTAKRWPRRTAPTFRTVPCNMYGTSSDLRWWPSQRSIDLLKYLFRNRADSELGAH